MARGRGKQGQRACSKTIALTCLTSTFFTPSVRPRDSEMSKTQGLLTGISQPRAPPHTCSKVSPGAEVWATASEHRGRPAQMGANTRVDDEGSPLAKTGGKGIPTGRREHRPEM